jgi:hypothetical protein
MCAFMTPQKGSDCRGNGSLVTNIFLTGFEESGECNPPFFNMLGNF